MAYMRKKSLINGYKKYGLRLPMSTPQHFTCYLCGSTDYIQRPGHARDNANLKPLECSQCGLVQLSAFDHIASNFYKNGHMHDSQPVSIETELVQSQVDTSRRLELFLPVLIGKRLLDIGCGAGSFLMAAKKYTQDIAGVEPEAIFQKYFSEQKLNVFQSIKDIPCPSNFDIVTLFHVLEHIKDPVNFLIEIAKILKSSTSKTERLCIIEVPHANDALLTLYKNKYFQNFTYWSCHLYLFTEKTLQMCAEKAGFKKVKIIQYQRYNLANHLYWLSHGLPGGGTIYREIMSPELEESYAKNLGKQKMCDTIIGIFSV